MTSRSRSLWKLAGFLILLPFSVTWLHLRHSIQRAHLVLVGPARARHENVQTKGRQGIESTFGIYLGPSRQVSALANRGPFHWNWPSIVESATVLATPTSSLLRRQTSIDSTKHDSGIVFNDDEWCLKTKSGLEFCTRSDSTSNEPPPGIWTSKDDTHLAITVSNPSYRRVASSEKSPTASPATNKSSSFRTNPNRKSRPNKNVEQVLRRPATTLLLVLNVGLAFVYWSRHVSPSAVAKIYSNMVQPPYELWRSFTGATAHFEPLHVGFNMMSLYSLGTELEESFGSIPFLLYNISLIPITTAIMVAANYLQIKWTGNTGLAQQSTVGYSGVLFAWMVIASLERPSTCPVFFAPSLCFDTHEIGGWLRFNVSPIIQLVVFQAIMPRVSFVGHLAGIVAGFGLHWNLLPLGIIQPSTLLPSILLLHYWRVRGLIPIVASGGDESSEDVESPAATRRLDARRYKRERDQQMQRLLVQARLVLSLVLVASCATLDSTLVLPLLLQLLLLHFSTQCHALLLTLKAGSDYEQEKERLGTLWKGFILSNVLVIIMDAMTLAGWVVTSNYWLGTSRIHVGLLAVVLVMVMRILLQLVILTLACKNLSDIGQTGSGIFVHLFGWTVLESARIVGNAIVATLVKRPTWAAFEGHGVTLGAAAHADNDNDASPSVVSEVL